jgi:Tfp pilus assembly protein PilF
MKSLLVLTYLITGCAATTARYIDDSRNEVALVSTDAPESLHGQGIKKGAADGAIKKLTASVTSSSTKEGTQDLSRKDSYLELARLYLAKGNLELAEKNVKSSLELDIKNLDSKLVLAQVYYRKGLLEMATMLLQGETMTGIRGSEMHNLLALIAIKKSKPEQAWANFETAIKLDETNVAARLNYGMMLLDHSLDRKAGIQFERTLSLVPTQPDALLMMAMIKARRGDLVGAEKDLEKLKSDHGKNHVVLYNYGSVLYASEKYQDSLDVLKSYLASTKVALPNSDEAISMIESAQDRLIELEKGDEEIAEGVKKMQARPASEIAKEAEEEKEKELKNSDADALNDLIGH